MKVSSAKEIGAIARKKRKELNITQKYLADSAGTGTRFISELENGKPTLEIDKVIYVLKLLGIDMEANER